MTIKQSEKVTFNISSELKAQVMKLKEELHISLSTIYNDAIREYIRQKELEKWEKGVNQALQDADYKAFSEEVGEDSGELYEY